MVGRWLFAVAVWSRWCRTSPFGLGGLGGAVGRSVGRTSSDRSTTSRSAAVGVEVDDESVAWEAAAGDLERSDWAPDGSDLILESDDASVWVEEKREYGACLGSEGESGGESAAPAALRGVYKRSFTVADGSDASGDPRIRQGSTSGAERLKHVREALSGSLLRVSPGVPILRGCRSSYSVGIPSVLISLQGLS